MARNGPRAISAALVLGLGLLARAAEPPVRAPEPPRARVAPTELEAHGQVRVDPYFWLNRRDDPEVLAYLQAENEYLEGAMAGSRALRETLFEEIVNRIPKDDTSVPYRFNGYDYYRRFEGEGEYPLYCRRAANPDAPEEILVNGNELGRGRSFFEIGAVAVSPGNDRVAFAVDTVGRRFYDLRFRDLKTGRLLPEEIRQVTDNLVWAEDNQTLFYTRQDPETLRAYQIYRHRLGTHPSEDILVYEEPDPIYACAVGKSKSRQYLFVVSDHLQSTEYRFVAADQPETALRLVQPRQAGHLYSVEHLGDAFYLRTNWEAENYRLMKTPVDRPGLEHWTEVIPHRERVLLEEIELFRDFLVAVERVDGLVRMRVQPWSGGAAREVLFDEPAYAAGLGDNAELDLPTLRYEYTSLTTPKSVYDYDLATGTRTLRKRDLIPGGFNPALYRTERLWAPARDGARVPISLVYRVDRLRDGSPPLLLYGYGSYGYSSEPEFRPDRLSLLDRGFTFAIAHIRGGQELGRRWYDQGRLHQKLNTFTDFIDCAEFLVREGQAGRARIYGYGGSAGGLLIGAVANLRPDLFHGLVAAVPFVDVVTTMLDDTIPLTTFEYEEWGNPHVKADYDYMLAYSPYDNVRAVAYPHLLVLAGLHDSQVQYWEPAKWVAKLRATAAGRNQLLLKTDLEAGHGGASGRFKRHQDTALIYAFLLGLAEQGK
ncbi:MAG: S9 family peptidase [Verrucomicrobia bacterium]|nr:S9 family peptidase [Verrucomicrobiota bacterium]